MIEEKRFNGKVVVVTGAGHGIGRAVAERFGLEGARVVVNDVDESRALDVARFDCGRRGDRGSGRRFPKL